MLTATDADEATAVGGTSKELVLWIKTDVSPTYAIWLATSDSGVNETKLTVASPPTPHRDRWRRRGNLLKQRL
jgi:hypothetical protein